jgi:hypothetical protein
MKTIQIEINNRRKVFAIRELFSNEFKNLKLEFYAKPHTEDGPHSEKIVRNSGFTVGDCRTENHNGILLIRPDMTISELKDYLRNTFGLKAEIYKLDGSSWITSDSGSISLEEFNRLKSVSQ